MPWCAQSVGINSAGDVLVLSMDTIGSATEIDRLNFLRHIARRYFVRLLVTIFHKFKILI